MVALKAKPPKKAKQSKPKILVYGQPGVGKTWGAIDFPSVYYIDCEGGANLPHYTDKLDTAGGVYLGPEDGGNDFRQVVEQIQALATQKHDYRTLVIDSYSKLFATAVQVEYDRMESSGKVKDMTSTYGAEKKPAVALTRKAIHWFDRLDMNVILICHERALWKNGEQIGVTFDGWDKLDYELDLVMQIVKQGNSRIANVGKCRLSQFATGESFPWSYLEFGNRYGLDVMEAEAVAVDLATPEQVEMIEGLAGLLKLSDTLRIKWFDKAGVDHWREMDTDTIARCIASLQKQIPETATA